MRKNYERDVMEMSRCTSDRPTVGIVEIVYGSIFFYSYVVPIHS